MKSTCEMMNLTNIQVYGLEKQALQLCEECGELIQAASKMVRSNFSDDSVSKMVEELADVMVVAKQFMQVFHVPDSAVEGMMEEKIHRQWARIQASNFIKV